MSVPAIRNFHGVALNYCPLITVSYNYQEMRDDHLEDLVRGRELLELCKLVYKIIQLTFYHTWVCIQLAISLAGYLVRGTNTWVFMCGRLFLFAGLLMPGWIRKLSFYFFSANIIRDIPYGCNPRNFLDVYLPVIKKENTVPVVVFVSGGAWIIGYKLWSALVARGLVFIGYVVVAPDYRNFPQGDITDMLEDVQASLEWTIENIEKYGGNPQLITLGGQSAGSHICMCLLVRLLEDIDRLTLQSLKEGTSSDSAMNALDASHVHESPEPVSTSSGTSSDMLVPTVGRKKYTSKELLSYIKLLVGVSGPYDMTTLIPHMQERGLDASLLEYVFKQDVTRYSPTIKLQNLMGINVVTDSSAATIDTCSDVCEHQSHRLRVLADLLPHVSLYHGSCDKCIPASSSQDLYRVLVSLSRSNSNSTTHTSSSQDSHINTSSHDTERSIYINMPAFSPPAKNTRSSRAAASPSKVTDTETMVNILSCHSSDSDVDISNSNTSQIDPLVVPLSSNLSHIRHTIYNELGHTDIIVEGPLCGDVTFVSDLHQDIQELVVKGSGFGFSTSPFVSMASVSQDDNSSIVHLDTHSRSVVKATNASEVLYSGGESGMVVGAGVHNHAPTAPMVHPRLVSIARQVNPF